MAGDRENDKPTRNGSGAIRKELGVRIGRGDGERWCSSIVRSIPQDTEQENMFLFEGVAGNHLHTRKTLGMPRRRPQYEHAC